MKLFFVTILFAHILIPGASQNIKMSVINDTTELQEYDNGQKLKINYRLNGRIISIKEKDKLIEGNPGIRQEFNIKNVGNDTVGEINFLQEDIIFNTSKNHISQNLSVSTLDISDDLIGRRFPQFAWTDLSNNQVSLESLKGKTIVLSFWHTSCVPCIAEIPLLNDLVKKYEGKDVVFISATPNSQQELIDFLKKRRFEYTQVPGVDTKTIFNPFPGWPIHIVLNTEGVIRFCALGKQNNIEQKLVNCIDKSLTKEEKP